MELVTKKGTILGTEDRNADAMATFYFNRLLTTLEWSKELLFAVYSFIDEKTLVNLEASYMELIPDADEILLGNIQGIHDEVIRKLGEKNGFAKMSGIFKSYWEKFMERYHGFVAFKDVGSTLKNTFKLSNLEIELLKIIYVEDKIVYFGEFISKLSFSQYIEVIALLLKVEGGEILHLLNKDQSLIKFEMIDYQNYFPPFLTMKPLLKPLFSGSKTKDISIGLAKSKNEKTFALESFPLPQDEIHIIKNLLIKPEPVNLLFYGQPGTGKSAFAFSLAESVNRPVYTFDIMESGEDYNDRPFKILAAIRHLPVNSILVIDEADRLLKSEGSLRSVDKGWLVNFLDHCNISTIWIVNNLSDLHNAVKRRFIYSKEFKLWNKEARTKLWASLVSTSPISKQFSNDQVEKFARRYNINVGNISSSIEAVSKLFQGGSIKNNEIESVLEKILGEQNRILDGAAPANKPNHQTPYDPNVIKSDQDILPIKDTLKVFINTPEKDRNSGINILFWGKPGTGKTAAVKFMAQQMGVSLNEKKSSDLIGFFVGETEKNIADFFRSMTGDNQVALLDEADSLFLNRAKARNVWERLQTNELLTHMENHTGILFCCTNDLESLDPAVIRRFTWKVEFSPMDKSGVKELFQKYFSISKNETYNWKAKIDKMTGLTPGDFGILWRRYNIAGNNVPDISTIIDDLEKELGYRKEKHVSIGF